MNGAERRSASGIDDAISAAEVEAVSDPARDDVSEQARERVLLPRDIGVGDPLHDVFGYLLFHAGVVKGAAPDRVTQTSAQRDNQLKGSSNAENDADARTVDGFRCASRFIAAGGRDRVTA